MSDAPFQAYGPSHLIVLGLTALGVGVMCYASRRKVTGLQLTAERLLAFVLFSEWPANMAVAYSTGEFTREVMLPAHLCDVAALLGGVALLTRRPVICELLYFWGLAGTLQGLLTPALDHDFPHPRFFTFFALHSGVVMAALYVVLGLGITPRRGGVGRAFFWILAYAGVAGLIDSMTGADYGFLRAKPEQHSLLDFLGPWPWYIVGLILVSVIFFVVLDLPWWWKRRGSRGAEVVSPPGN